LLIADKKYRKAIALMHVQKTLREIAMLSMHPSETKSASIPTGATPVAGSGWQRHRKLWSTLKEVCDQLSMTAPASVSDDATLFQHVQFKAGQRIHTIGQAFDMLYIVHSGFLKTVMVDESGNEQILAFPMKGDLFGIDGIHGKQFTSETVALSECDIILVPFKTFTALGRTHTDLESAIFGVMSRELVREQAMISTLATLSAEARVARFLAFLSERYTQMGYSGTQFNLRLTRHEIGNYLGLTLETVSRTLSAFNAIGLISIEQKAVVLNDIPALKTLRRLPPSQARSKMKEEKAANSASLSSAGTRQIEELTAA
jgi:CRP/FNR family transcriptional regulator